jgi:putative transposase
MFLRRETPPMSETMIDAVDEPTVVEPGEDAGVGALDVQMLRRLAGQARDQGLELTGEGGLLQQLTKVFLESALEGEMDAHLGYPKHDPSGENSGNSRNGRRAKRVITEVGPVEVAVPRDRDASFTPQLVKKRQRRLSGVDEMVLSLSAKGLTHGEISAHLADVYGANVS